MLFWQLSLNVKFWICRQMVQQISFQFRLLVFFCCYRQLLLLLHIFFFLLLESYMDCNCNNFQKWLKTPDISDNVYKPFIRKSNFSGLRGNIRVTNVTFSSLLLLERKSPNLILSSILSVWELSPPPRWCLDVSVQGIFSWHFLAQLGRFNVVRLHTRYHSYKMSQYHFRVF